MNPHFKWLATRLGLTLMWGDSKFPGNPILGFIRNAVELVETYKGKPLKIYHWCSRSGNKNGPTHATARIECSSSQGLTFQLSRELLRSKLGKSLGMQDVQTGDERFDNLFIVKTNKPDYIKIILTPDMRIKLSNCWELYKPQGVIKLTETELFYDELGRIKNEKNRERFPAICDVLVEIAKHI